MIRNLLVLNVTSTSRSEMAKPLNEVILMPQGRRGVLPNMDLVFLAMTVIARATFMDSRRYETIFIVHPHADASRGWRAFVDSTTLIPASLRSWLSELGDLALFARTLALGPYPAHAPTLERGIDAVTLQIHFSTPDAATSRAQAEFELEFVKRLEGMVRALSNLHERLHHSVTQYLMPSPFKFVSHTEYLIPNLLLLLPLVVRAVSLILSEMKDVKFDFAAFQMVVGVGVTALGIYEVCRLMDTMAVTVLVVMVYGAIPVACRFVFSKEQQASSYQSLHFLTCLAAIYFIVPLILGHVSLALPSALLWSPLIGMLSHRPATTTSRASVVLPFLLLCTWPPIWVQRVFGTYSIYISFVHLPLHLLVSVLWYMQTLSNKRS